jgi:hypothetical protein
VRVLAGFVLGVLTAATADYIARHVLESAAERDWDEGQARLAARQAGEKRSVADQRRQDAADELVYRWELGLITREEYLEGGGVL